MSYTIHDAIIVTTHRMEAAISAREQALLFGLSATDIVESGVNGWMTFLIVPDGSKEGWPESDKGAAAREQWVAWAREQWKAAASPPFDGGAFLHFVHVAYGDTHDEEPKLVDWQPDEASKR